MLIQRAPSQGCATENGSQSLPVNSSLSAMKQQLQSLQRARSMTMFHFLAPAIRPPPRSPSRRHFSISMRQELFAIPEDIGVMNREGERTFTQPPRSADSPGFPMGSYSAQDS